MQHQSNKNEVQALNNKVDIRLTNTQGDIAKLDSKMDREVAQLMATFERHKSESQRYAIGTCFHLLNIDLNRKWPQTTNGFSLKLPTIG